MDPRTSELESRVGKLGLSSRYHKLPRKIDEDYEITRRVLGTGVTGAVKLARNKSNKQQCAVKTCKLRWLAPDKQELLRDEIAVHLAMDHPHIVSLFDVYEEKHTLYLVMEVMEGGELFDRLQEKKTFAESDAAGVIWQMLLALNYIHSHGVVHRDLKLENFLYDKKGSDNMKLIDFGFGKMFDPNIQMHSGCGTLGYVAPEVLKKSYTVMCDMWSLGVIAFILLAGYMPFKSAAETETGRYTLKPERWNHITLEAKDFVRSLLQVDPEQRTSAEKALKHQWLARRNDAKTTDIDKPEVEDGVIDALRSFANASKFRRSCLQMMAWSLSAEERAKVTQDFLDIDKNHSGTILLSELKDILTKKLDIPNEEIQRIFQALDYNNDEEIHYSDFLAAMVSTRIVLHDDLLLSAFKKFDHDGTGFITVENLRMVLGDDYQGDRVETLLQEADILKDNRISYAEFVAYLKEQPLEEAMEAAAHIIDDEAKQLPASYIGGRMELATWLRQSSDWVRSVSVQSLFSRSSGTGVPAAVIENMDEAELEAAVAQDQRAPPSASKDQKMCCVIA